jgi:hypothetical protein
LNEDISVVTNEFAIKLDDIEDDNIVAELADLDLT